MLKPQTTDDYRATLEQRRTRYVRTYAQWVEEHPDSDTHRASLDFFTTCPLDVFWENGDPPLPLHEKLTCYSTNVLQ